MKLLFTKLVKCFTIGIMVVNRNWIVLSLVYFLYGVFCCILPSVRDNKVNYQFVNMVTEVYREVSHITYTKEALLNWKQARMLDNTMKRILESIPSSLRRRKRGKRESVTEVYREVSHIIYTKEALLNWKQARMLDNTMKRILESIPSSPRRRKRGKRAGLRSRLRKRKCKLPLPTIIFGNVRSISKQYTEVLGCVKYLQDYRNACAFCFTETWLHPGIPDSAVEIEGFHLFRMDRTEDSVEYVLISTATGAITVLSNFPHAQKIWSYYPKYVDHTIYQGRYHVLF